LKQPSEASKTLCKNLKYRQPSLFTVFLSAISRMQSRNGLLICYMQAYFWSPYLSQITRSTCMLECSGDTLFSSPPLPNHILYGPLRTQKESRRPCILRPFKVFYKAGLFDRFLYYGNFTTGWKFTKLRRRICKIFCNFKVLLCSSYS